MRTSVLKGQIFWDLDGTLVDTIPLKGELFSQVFDDFPDHHDGIIEFHLKNGGLNRVEKIRRMGVEVLKVPQTATAVAQRAERFGELVRVNLLQAPLADGAFEMLTQVADHYKMHVVTAMPEDEAVALLSHHGILRLFASVSGHPDTKTTSIQRRLNYMDVPAQSVLFGDSPEDQAAALESGVGFVQVRLRHAPPIEGAFAILDGTVGSASRILGIMSALT